MTDLFRPSDERAGSVMSNGALLAATVRVEAAWLQVFDARIAPEAAADELAGPVDPSGDDIGTIAAARRPAKHHTGSTTSALPPQPA